MGYEIVIERSQREIEIPTELLDIVLEGKAPIANIVTSLNLYIEDDEGNVLFDRELLVSDFDVTDDRYEITVENMDKHYEHDQAAALAVWTIAHGLSKYPSVSVIDSAGNDVFGEVDYIDSNNLTITFQAAFSGTAYLN